ncbi:MAG: NPCBM/NEW2 domain-containing protein [Acidobacteriota bacterium]|jgi:hypothetical protein|nr:NPCBM/NEW2 domain-containing protein [Acidobacteriota bacterium]
MSKKNVLKGMIIVFVVVCLMSGITVFASIGQRTLTAHFNNIEIVVDGEVITPRDGNGNIVEPFVVDGTTYLPVRALADAFGKDVRWDGDTNTIFITSSADTSSQPVSQDDQVRLSEMDYLGSHWEKTSEMQMSTGDFAQDVLSASYINPIFSQPGVVATADYLLNGEFSRMSGTLFLSYEGRDPRSTQRFVVWGDGIQIYTSPEIEGGFLPIVFDIDVTGVNVMRIINQYDSWTSGRTIGISNTVLTR